MNENPEHRDARILEQYVAGVPVGKICAEFKCGASKVYALSNAAGIFPVTPQRTVASLIAAAARITKFSADDILGKSRLRPVVRVRQAVMYQARLDGHSFPIIGQRMGGRDHSTVIHACSLVENLIARNEPAMVALVAAIDAGAAKRGEVRVVEEVASEPEPIEPAVSYRNKPHKRVFVPVQREAVACTHLVVNDDGEELTEFQFAAMVKRGSANLAKAIFAARAA